MTKEPKKRRRRVPGMRLVPGATFDLEEDEHGQTYDVLKASDRARIRDRVNRDKPFLVVGSPKCTDYFWFNTAVHHHRMSPEERARRLAEREVILRFAVEVYRMQLAGGRHFLHEHPLGAESWKEPFVEKLMGDSRVGSVIADQCRFGLRIDGPRGEPTLAKKPTRFMSSAPAILESLDRRCRGDHVHQRISGGRNRGPASQVYPTDLCRSILRGAEEQRYPQGPPLSVLDTYN